MSTAQNQTAIDSLLQVLKTKISDQHKLDIYVEIIKNYDKIDFEKTDIYTYGNEAIRLANKINYTESSIDALYYIGGYPIRQEKNIEAEQIFIKLVDLVNKKDNHIKELKFIVD